MNFSRLRASYPNIHQIMIPKKIVYLYESRFLKVNRTKCFWFCSCDIIVTIGNVIFLSFCCFFFRPLQFSFANLQFTFVNMHLSIYDHLHNFKVKITRARNNGIYFLFLFCPFFFFKQTGSIKFTNDVVCFLTTVKLTAINNWTVATKRTEKKKSTWNEKSVKGKNQRSHKEQKL